MRYTGSGGIDNDTATFIDNEQVFADKDIIFGDQIIGARLLVHSWFPLMLFSRSY